MSQLSPKGLCSFLILFPIIALLNNGATKAYIARKYESSQPNLYNWLKKNEIAVKAEL